MSTPIIVFSHLRWDFVYQRPQQVLSRLARERPIFFIEEPLRDEQAGKPYWEKSQPEPNVTVCRPRTIEDQPGRFCQEQMPALRLLVRQLLAKEKSLKQHVAWFYTPMALPLADLLSPGAVVYDCMDELSAFLGAPPELLEHEKQLLQQADVVFTGGPSLYRSKKDRHPNVLCLPSSVDRQHFAKAIDGVEEAPQQASLPTPRLGFFGVIDERMDLALLDELAAARPNWQIIMVGPVVKIDPASLPRRDNLHYLGGQSYADLPRFIRGWDVAIMPFARNESTRFISPTKTLEYMAAQRLIVSTPITDVAEPYGDIVYLGEDAPSFIAACDAALGASEEERAQRLAKMERVLERTSWDRTAKLMDQAIQQVEDDHDDSPSGRGGSRGRPRSARPKGSAGLEGESTPPVIVAGAGPTGLSAAFHLGPKALLVEKQDRVGGWCKSIKDKGFTFDYAGHIMFSKESYVHDMYKMLLGDNVHWQDREAWIYSKEVYTRYPFQGCLYGLPADVIVECIMGAIEAQYGKPAAVEMEDAVAKAAQKSEAANGNGHSSNGNGRAGQGRNGNGQLRDRNGNGQTRSRARDGNGHTQALRSEVSRDAACRLGDVKDCCGDGILEAEVELREGGGQAGSDPQGPPRNFEEFIYRVWGKGIAKHFAIPYNRKLWAVDLKEMETSWLGGRVPMPNIEEMIRYALTPACKPMGPNARFGYPLRGGFQALMNGFLPHVGDRLLLNTGVAAISPRRHTVTLSDGRTLPYAKLISTMPLPLLIRSLGKEAPPEVREVAGRLRHISVRCVNIGVGRENLTEKHWIYYPEDTVFHRIFVQGNASPFCNPPGGFGLTCEITYSPDKPLPCDGQELIDLCIRDCRRVKFFDEKDAILTANQVDLPFAYVVYDHQRPKNVKLIRDYLAEQDIILAGRYSEWEYYNSDHAFVAGRRAAEQALAELGLSAEELITAPSDEAPALVKA